MSFYSYLIGKLYSWALKKENDTPVTNVVLTMCIVHFFQFLTVYMILHRIFNFPDYILGLNRIYVGLFLIIFPMAYKFFIFRQDKWKCYVKQIEEEEEKKMKQGKLLVLLYLIGSILMFFISLPLIFS